MQKIVCRSCGQHVCEDDFASMCCPICDSFMPLNELDKRVTPELCKVIRIAKIVPMGELASVGL